MKQYALWAALFLAGVMLSDSARKLPLVNKLPRV